MLIGTTVARANEVVYIEKGKPAPFTGVLFTEEKAAEVRKTLLEGDKTEIKLAGEKSKVESLGRLIQLKDSEIDLYRKQNTSLLRQEQTSENMRYIWFGLGVLATGMAVYGAGALSR